MSLYVVPENQELLWNVISKNAYIQDFFAPYNPEKKNEWFKAIIRTFYERYKLQKLTVADLNYVNKETITYMIQNVREQISQPVAKTTAPTQATPSYQPANSYSIPTPPIVPDTRVDIYAKEFEQRQQEYANLNKKVAPANVNFMEKADDGVIQNMDELVKQQMQQRAYEMSLIPPPVNKVSQMATSAPMPTPAQAPMPIPAQAQPMPMPAPASAQTLANTFVQNAPPKLQIDAESNIEISIEELGSANSTPLNIYNGTPDGVPQDVKGQPLLINQLKGNPPTEDCSISNIHLSKKSVTWKTDEPDVNRVDTEMLVLHETINNITQEFAQLKQLYELSQNSIAELKDANAGLTTKLNHFVEWAQHSIVQLAEANAGMATKLNNSVEWSHISIVHLNEANTGLTMKYNELLANQVAPAPAPAPIPVPVPVPAHAPVPSPDEIKSTMERILTQIDGE